MKAYKIKHDWENYYSLIIKNAELGSKMPTYSPRFDAKPRAKEWVKPNASFYASSNYAHEKAYLPDITTWLTGNLVFNEKSYALLSDRLQISGEILPISIEGMDYYVLNTLKVIEDQLVNTEKAVNVNELGVDLGLANIAFYDDDLDGALLFKSNIDKLVSTYCTQEFKDLLVTNGLKGLIFEEISQQP